MIPSLNRYDIMMTPQEQAILIKYARQTPCYVEFGMGGSTFLILMNSMADVVSIESSKSWIAEMEKKTVTKIFKNRRLRIVHAEIGPTTDWGYPVDEERRMLFPNYSSAIASLEDKDRVGVVLVDGRFRIAATLGTILSLKANKRLIIMIHDFWGRSDYHVVMQYLDLVERADQLAVFRVKKDVQLQNVESDYEKCKFLPD
jgi:hypothetical protein